eukprot:TRINITY_DN2731_c0_g1_i2.p2 TRINITY_DN2731_c0_g1~~TRINITY_DN2731_c0_g1_i2.p2  ORF type:complete len:103 (-),score=13.84 TRINITY_DN2731_c0_g1_i2:337-645(-)
MRVCVVSGGCGEHLGGVLVAAAACCRQRTVEPLVDRSDGGVGGDDDIKRQHVDETQRVGSRLRCTDTAGHRTQQRLQPCCFDSISQAGQHDPHVQRNLERVL